MKYNVYLEMIWRSLGVIRWIASLITTVALPGSAAEPLMISRTEKGLLHLEWELKSIAPNARNTIPVAYQLESSQDLAHWERTGDPIVLERFENQSRHSVLIENQSENSFFRYLKSIPQEHLFLGSDDLSQGKFAHLILNGRTFSFSQIHSTDFSGASLVGAHMFAVNGSQVMLTASQLMGANLTASVVVQSNFMNADLHGATIRFGRFSDNDFSNSDLRFVDFTGTDLFNSNMENADLRGAILLDTDLRFVRFHGSRIDPLTRIPPIPHLVWQIVNEGRAGADLSQVNLTGAHLLDSDLRGTNFTKATLTAVDLRGSDLRDANLSRVNFDLLNISNTQINEATILPRILRVIWGIVNLKEDHLQLNRFNLEDAVLIDGHLVEANLQNAKLNRAVLIGANLSHADMRDCQLSGAFLQGADLRFANMEGANLRGAQLTSALFEQTIMPDGSIRNP